MESQMMTSSPPLSISSLGCNGRAYLKEKGSQKEKVKIATLVLIKPRLYALLCALYFRFLSDSGIALCFRFFGGNLT